MKKIVVLIPTYNEQENLIELTRRLAKVFNENKSYSFDILFADDGSTDDTCRIIIGLAKENPNIKYLFLSRNYGKEICLSAGIDAAYGDALICMDADMQDPPELITSFIAEWENGYEDVIAYRTRREGEGFFKKYTSNLFYRIIKKSTNIYIPPNSGDFRLLDKKCVDALKQFKEKQRYNKGIFSLIGFSKKLVPFERSRRYAGKTKYKIRSLVRLAINGITSFSTAPLKIATFLGVIGTFISVVFALVIIIKKVVHGDPVIGFPALITLISFLGSLQLVILGIIGEYIGIIFNEVKDRPNYIIGQTNIS